MSFSLGAAEPKRKPKPLKVSEADIQRTCEDILKWDGWRIFRIEQNFSEKKQRSFGEEGAPDALCVRYHKGNFTPRYQASECQVMWLEWKALDGKPTRTQMLWQAAERGAGALVLCAGIDFSASIEDFREWYAASGLQRRK